jgi:DNA-directed RNA polymerase sigma subunit (sigma70/sigma32)
MSTVCPHLGRPLTEWEAACAVDRRPSDIREARDAYWRRRERAALAFVRSFGPNHKPLTMTECADLLGISVQRVEQLERSALDKLRKALSDLVE